MEGFTLVEILVVVTLLGLMAATVTQIFVLGLRSQSKSEALKEAKQNGDYTLSVMERMIRNASDISSSCNTSSDQLTIVNPDGFTTTFLCTDGADISSASGGMPVPTPDMSYSLTSSKVAINNCIGAFTVVCPTPPINPKYVFIDFTVNQAGVTPAPGANISLDYQSTVSLRQY